MSASVSGALPASGAPPEPLCQHCGRRVDASAIGTSVGLCHCPSCQGYACRWCWAEAPGVCPMCAIPFSVAAAASVAVHRPAAAAAARPDRRAPVAAGTLVLAVALLALVLGGGTRPAGGVEGAVSPSSDAGAQAGTLSSPTSSRVPTGTTGASATPPAAASPAPVATLGPIASVPPDTRTPSPTPTR